MQMLVDLMLNDQIPEIPESHNFVSSYKNDEYYYGFSAYYGNLSLRLNYRPPYAAFDPELTAALAESNEAAINLLWERSKEGVRRICELKFPDAIPFVSGIPVDYNITILVYMPDGVTSESIYYTYKYRCIDIGTFEYISHAKTQ
jgi:hypothetical protein